MRSGAYQIISCDYRARRLSNPAQPLDSAQFNVCFILNKNFCFHIYLLCQAKATPHNSFSLILDYCYIGGRRGRARGRGLRMVLCSSQKPFQSANFATKSSIIASQFKLAFCISFCLHSIIAQRKLFYSSLSHE